MTTAKEGLARRGFFKAALGAAAAGAVTAGGAIPAEAAESADERKKPRYQDSEHVKMFYRVNRYEPKKGA